jgi:hypothetical protein
LQKSWHGHLAREKRPFSWQIPAMNHGQDARATLFASPSESLHSEPARCFLGLVAALPRYVECGTLAAAVPIEQASVEEGFPENQSGSKRAAVHIKNARSEVGHVLVSLMP